jgi:hypothetical protein
MRTKIIRSINRLDSPNRYVVGLAISFFPSIAYAATNNSGAGASLFLPCAIAYLTRRRAIGGWLSYFYFQLYISLIIWPLLFAANVFQYLSPTGWEDKGQYVLFVLSTVPLYMAMSAEALFATVALFRRDLKHVRHLRFALIAMVITAALALAIDLGNFRDSLPLDCLTLFFAVIWCIYFFRSDRVKWVLIENRWNYEAFVYRNGAPTLEELQRAKRKGWIAGGITLVLIVLLCALSANKSNLAEVLAVGTFVGVFYGAIIGAIVQHSASHPKREKIRTVADDSQITSVRAAVVEREFDQKPSMKGMLNFKQKVVLLVTAACVIGALIYPPFVIHHPQSGAVYNEGYAFLFSQSGAVVNTSLLAIELLVILFVGIAVIFVTKNNS